MATVTPELSVQLIMLRGLIGTVASEGRCVCDRVNAAFDRLEEDLPTELVSEVIAMDVSDGDVILAVGGDPDLAAALRLGPALERAGEINLHLGALLVVILAVDLEEYSRTIAATYLQAYGVDVDDRDEDPVRDLAAVTGGALELGDADPVDVAPRLAQDLADELGRILAPAPDQLAILDRTLHRVLDLAQDAYQAAHHTAVLQQALLHIDEYAYYLANDIGYPLAAPVDVRGGDLSHRDLPSPDLLAGLIWDRDTRWPPGIGDLVRTRSAEIHPDVFAVVNPQ